MTFKKTLIATMLFALPVNAALAVAVYRDGVSTNINALGINQDIVSQSRYSTNNLSDKSDNKALDWLSDVNYNQWDVSSKNDPQAESKKSFKKSAGFDIGFGNSFKNLSQNISSVSLETAIKAKESFSFKGNSTAFKDKEIPSLKAGYSTESSNIFANLQYTKADTKGNILGSSTNLSNKVEIDSSYRVENTFVGPATLSLNYAKAQGQGKASTPFNSLMIDSAQTLSASISFGLPTTGAYLACLFYDQEANLDENSRYSSIDRHGYEVQAGYGFENGVSLFLGYGYFDSEIKSKDSNHKSYKIRSFPVKVNYSVNDNFNVWTEAAFNTKVDEKLNRDSETKVSAGARYTF